MVFSCRLFLVFFTLKNSFSSNLLVIKAGGFRGENCAKNRQKKLVGFLADVALKMYICVHNHPFVSTIRNALVMAVFPMGRGWLLTAQILGGVGYGLQMYYTQRRKTQ